MVASIRAAQSATLVPVNFFTADSLSAGFLPLYCRYLRSDPRRASTLFWWVAALLLLASCLVLLILLVCTPQWIQFLVPGFGAEERLRTVDFVQTMGVGVPFYLAGGLLSYLEMGHNSYTLVSIRATLQSVGMIAGTLAAYILHQPSLLAWGFTLAYMVYAGLGVWRVTANDWLPRSQRLQRSDLREVATEFWSVIKPLLFLPIFLQGNIVAERAVASLLGVDASAALDYAKFITDTGVLLLAVPLGLAGLSAISQMTRDESGSLLRRILPGLLLVTVPLSVALAAHGHLVVSLVYQRGRFDESSTKLTQTILGGFAIGFWAQVIGYVLIKVLSAQLRNSEVFRYMVIALLSNVVINFALYKFIGPSVMGLGSCVYGGVLLFFCAKTLGLGRLIGERLFWLGIGSAGYVVAAFFLPESGWIGLLIAGVAFLAYWVPFVMVVPVLRCDVLPILAQCKVRVV